MNQTNSEMPISSFTLNELITMAGGEKRPGIMGECIAANSASEEMEIFRFPSRLNALIIGVGTEGETSLTSNLQEFRLKKDSLFIFSPKHILQVQSNNRFKAHLIVIAPDFLKRINIDTKRMMPLFLQFGSLPCMELTHAESQSLRSFISMVEQELKGSETDFSSEIIGGLIAATIYKVGDILTHYLTEHPEVDSPIHNRAEEYFRQFTELLGEHYKHERSVGFYARQLCITPKYLTTLIKRISGKSVSEWIDNYVILEAKTLLKYSNMSVQEIAYYLNFPNQSFFGSYFKRNAGMSPSQYKAKK
ncbi:helix-turn-helix domain-containing protein [Alistipes shahii]|uniref:helix-turn-helix domain-containing protein n=3 Tax=Alistipes shahii TaxID=328814 RepID=UPI0020975453|nr:AraC family transcriptional regulator [Alistipes shahii]MCO7106817.1 AraC family transcriptional regulator [Alistipes shahii]